MKPPALAPLSLLLFLAAAGPAAAISTLQDTIEALPTLSRNPSTVPPNNAVHRNFGLSRQPAGQNAPPTDEGAEADAPLAPWSASGTPWTVAISEGPNLAHGFICAGTLIDKNWVLTAAHCTFMLERRWPNDSDAYVFLDTVDLSKPGRSFVVKEIVSHPEYNPVTLHNDVALVRIDTSNAKPPVSPIAFEGPPVKDMLGEIGSILGWGITTSSFSKDHHEQIQVVQSAIIDNEVCFSSSVYPELRTRPVFCARSLFKYHNVCFRFGGSPVALYDKKGLLYVAGLVSWPAECSSATRKPNVFNDVHFYIPWIRSVIGRAAGAS